MTRRLPALLGAAALVLVLLAPPQASAGCGLGSSRLGAVPVRTTAGAPVLVYGDSITAQVAGRLLLARRDVAVDAWPGRRTLDAVTALVRDLEGRPAPRTVVMALGTNDTRSPQLVGALARYARSVVPPVTRLLWVTTYAEPWPGWQDVNAELAGVPGVQLVHWAALNAAARGAAGSSPLLRDGVHLGCAGADAWLDLVTAAIGRAGP